jgi:hypothetical protein
VDRINELEKEGRLTGIIDDRGKYIFITPEELEVRRAAYNNLIRKWKCLSKRKEE